MNLNMLIFYFIEKKYDFFYIIIYMLRPIITLFFINIIFTFSKYYKKCRLGNKNRDIGNITY
jgi:hypothetical protein